MKIKNTLSVCMVAYHEEALIARALNSVQGVADEIIVLHDGKCHDNTLKIAKLFGAKTKEIFPFKGEAEPHRQKSFSMAKGEWVMMLDADEYLSDHLQRELLTILRYDGIYDGFSFLTETWCDNKLITKGLMGRLKRFCIYRRSAMLPFSGLPHDNVVLKPGSKVLHYNRIIHHRPHDLERSFETEMKKQRRVAKIHAKILVQRGLR